MTSSSLQGSAEIINASENGRQNLRLRHYASWVSYITGFTCLAVGCYSQMGPKWMNRQKAPKCATCEASDFEGALVQTLVMFVGESLCLLVWKIDQMWNEPKGRVPLFDFITDEAQLRATGKCRWWMWAVAAFFDCLGSTFLNIGTLITYASTVSMLRNLMIPAAMLFQMVQIKKAMRVHQVMGSGLMTVALVLSAIPSFQKPESSKYSQGKIILGIILAILGTILQSYQIIFEEFAFRKGPYPPLKAMGIEGVCGFVISVIIAIFWQMAGVENVLKGFYQLFHQNTLLTLGIFYLFGSTAFNAAALATTKLGGGFMRGIMQASRAPLVWLLSLAARWQDYENWNLASSIIFVMGFIVYANWTPVLRHKPFIVKPLHCCCTDPALDNELAPGLVKKESQKNDEVNITRQETDGPVNTV